MSIGSEGVPEDMEECTVEEPTEGHTVAHLRGLRRVQGGLEPMLVMGLGRLRQRQTWESFGGRDGVPKDGMEYAEYEMEGCLE